MPTLTTERAFTVRYIGSLEQYHDQIGCATPEGEWTGPETTRYTVVLWDGGPTLHHVRRRSIEGGSVTVWSPEGGGPCICRCGAGHDRYPNG